MRLHTNIRQGNVGLLKSTPAWLFDYQLELNEEEASLIKTYQLGDMIVAKWTDADGKPNSLKLSQLIDGHKGHCFRQLPDVYATRDEMIEGCGGLRNLLRSIIEIRGGGAEQIIDIPIYSQQSTQPVPDAARASA
jgi:hypothetical protein